MERLPKSVDYTQQLAIMPDSTTNYIVTNTPTNGSSFTQGGTIIVDLNNVQGFLDPASLSFRYKYTAVTASKAAASATTIEQNAGIVGCPAFTPFLRLDVLANSAVIESINNYNSLATMISNTQYDISQKFGLQAGFGYAGVAGDTIMDNQEDTDGITFISTDGGSFSIQTVNNFISAPLLGCSLSNCEKLIPLNGPSFRLQFTLDTLSNIGSNLANDAALTAYTITNFEVVYNQIQFPSNVHQQIMSVPKIRIKTKSYGVGTQPISADSTGTVNLYYNLRYASVRSLVLACGGSSTTLSANKLMEAVDPTGTAGGTIQFSVGGVVIPQNPFNTITNRSGVLTELRRAVMGNIYDRGNSLSIGASEFNKTSATATSIYIPGKFYCGVSTMKLSDSIDYMFSGISSANSQINVILNIGTAPTGNALTALLFCQYDAIYEIDTLTKQMNYIQ
jgi:hypothetical protein